MADYSGIEWTDATWVVVEGCIDASTGCKICYAKEVVYKLAHNPNPKISLPLAGLTEQRGGYVRWTGKVALRYDRLDQPRKWKKPRMIFIPSLGDLFYEEVPFDFVDKVFEVMADTPRHRYQLLTKRPQRMAEYLAGYRGRWPLSHVWLGVSVENRQWLSRVDVLRAIPAAIRFLSLEPLLEDLGTLDLTGIHWVIVGGESGPDRSRRPMRVAWVRNIADQCIAAGVPVFVKQDSGRRPGKQGRLPDDLWALKQFPRS
jgi:protein gp37